MTLEKIIAELEEINDKVEKFDEILALVVSASWDIDDIKEFVEELSSIVYSS